MNLNYLPTHSSQPSSYLQANPMSDREGYEQLDQYNYPVQQSHLEEGRKREILQRLQNERDLRRQYIQEGKAEQFKLDSLGGSQMVSHQRDSAPQQYGYPSQEHQMLSGMKDPNDILFSTQKREEEERRYEGGDQRSFLHQSDKRSSNSELVQKLLQDRKVNRSRQVIDYTGSKDQTSFQQMNHSSSDPSHTAIGGFNPEALYQEAEEYPDEEPRYSQQQRDFSQYNAHELSPQSSHSQYSQQQPTDHKYRDAVQYAKAQIQKEMQKKSKLNNLYSDVISSYPSDRRSNAQTTSYQGHNQDLYHLQQEEEAQYRHPAEPERYQMGTNQTGNRYPQASTAGVGEGSKSLRNMEKQIAQNSTYKSLAEMNSKNAERSQKRKRHNFEAEAEEEEQRQKAPRPQSAAGGKGEYMKNTIGADLKKGQQPTTHKSRQLLDDVQKKFQEEYTFKPKINDYQVAPSKEVSKEERWKKLTEPKTVELQKRDKLKAQLEIEEAKKTCPFKPLMSAKKPSSGSRLREKENELPLQERLLHEADLRKEKREKLKREMELERMKDCSFKPKLLSNSSSSVNINKYSGQLPIHERVGSLQKEKNEKLQKLRMQSEIEQSDLTFKPKVNQKSSKIATVKRIEEEGRPTDVVERLYKDASSRIEKSMNVHESVHEQLNRDHPFQPQISKTSNYMSEKSDMFHGNYKDFNERQQAFQEKMIEKRENHKQMFAQENQCTFKPVINVTSEIICESDPKRGTETEEDRYMRLYKKDQKKAEVVKEMIEQEVYSQYTFKPQINKISKTLAKDTTLDELAFNPRGLQKKEMLQEQYQTQEVSECTFKPATTKNKKYNDVNSTYQFGATAQSEEFSKNLKEKLKEKQERIALERREREYQLMKDCTFKPTVLETIPATAKDQVVVVRGLGRHLELKELQKKKEDEKKWREAEVFGLNHKFAVNATDMDMNNPNRSMVAQSQVNTSAAQGFTVQKPFDLSSGVQGERRQKLMKELKEKELTECTFKPSTNEGRNRQLIKEILKETDKENTCNGSNYYQESYDQVLAL